MFGTPISSRGEILGCTSCPLNNAPGIRKIKGLERIQGRKAFLWAMAPGEEENNRGLELVGRSGELLWKTLAKFGLSRNDFDLQNICRCRPTDETGQNRDPSKRELQCCSVYNDEALRLNKGSAVVHVIMGEVAGTQLLGKGYHKDKPIFWYKPWDAYIVLQWHPSYILRQGGEKAGWDYYTWRDRFKAVKNCIQYPGRFGYIKSRQHKIVRTISEFDAMEKALRKEQKLKRLVSTDVEDGYVEGNKTILIAGFGTGHYQTPKDEDSWTGDAWSVVLDHPQAGYEPSHLEELRNRTRKLVEDQSLQKCLQNGSYDFNQYRDLLQARLRGYEYDSMYGTFLRYTFLRSCSLENLTYRFFPEYCDYKDATEGYENFADCPIDTLCLRNGGDCEITKRLEEKFGSQVSRPLVKIYCHVGKTLDGMEKRGPLLDWENWKAAKKIVPDMLQRIDRQLSHIADDPDFNAGSAPQVAHLVYDVLKLPEVEGMGRSTGKDVLEELMAQTGDRSLELIQKRRALDKIEGTYLDGYAKSAELHNGELHTIWWLTGAVSTRLRSGKGDKAEAEGIVNFQNTHGNPLLSNLLVSDVNWRRAKEDKYDLSDLNCYLSCDGSQLEVRILSEVSGDELLISQFNSGADIHSLIGHTLTGWSVEKIKSDKNTRKMVKNMIFGIIYGLGRENLYPYVITKIRQIDGKNADLTGITKARLGKLFDQFFIKYKGVKAFVDRTRKQVEDKGYAETLFGPVRIEIKKDDKSRTTYWANRAVNIPIQGTAHQFVLTALALLDMKPVTYSLLRECLAEIHDELLFRVRFATLPEAQRQLIALFTEARIYLEKHFHHKMKTPIKVESNAGFVRSSMIDYNGEPLVEFLPKWRAKQLEVESKSWEDLMPHV